MSRGKSNRDGIEKGNNNVVSRHQIGWFAVKEEWAKSNPNLLMEVLGEIFIVDVVTKPWLNQMFYLGYSNRFDAVDLQSSIPEITPDKMRELFSALEGHHHEGEDYEGGYFEISIFIT